ncbi:hypothetical protein H9Q10_09380 [Eikenella sp. S3360]|uniref:Uncharacterized protein n=1 Tax=Eikenella glucosivorans TaxID=2766967 RepID=A0ABS0NC89_9NEIS|nr:hypothetical protein [Eikenella glucosivorans]MBH5329875.1 hypothetical protein [Eikenella glucosivorans]
MPSGKLPWKGRLPEKYSVTGVGVNARLLPPIFQVACVARQGYLKA